MDGLHGLLNARGMDFQLHDEPEAFWAATGAVYEADPIKHTVALTVLRGLLAAGSNGGEQPLLVSITDGRDVVGGVFCTPPWPLGVSAVPVQAVPQLVDYLQELQFAPPGVSGPRDPADAFAAAWGPAASLLMNMRCYRLDRLREPQVPGEFRLGGMADVGLLAQYLQAFMTAVVGSDVEDRPQLRIRQSLVLGNAHGIWSDDGVVRAVARASIPQRGMSRVGLVYTPPEHRRRGYGAAVTAAASRWALDAGADDVVLFTDLANPTSNSIYQRIGYVPVYDAVEYRFATTVS